MVSYPRHSNYYRSMLYQLSYTFSSFLNFGQLDTVELVVTRIAGYKFSGEGQIVYFKIEVDDLWHFSFYSSKIPSTVPEILLYSLPGSIRIPHPAQRYPCFVIVSFRLEK